MDQIQTKMILYGVTKEEQKEAEKTVRKLIKKLRKGKLDEVYDMDRYTEYMETYEG